MKPLYPQPSWIHVSVGEKMVLSESNRKYFGLFSGITKTGRGWEGRDNRVIIISLFVLKNG